MQPKTDNNAGGLGDSPSQRMRPENMAKPVDSYGKPDISVNYVRQSMASEVSKVDPIVDGPISD